MKLSLVVPVVRAEAHLDKLFDTLIKSCKGVKNIELIVVNQSGTSIRSMCGGLPMEVREVMTQTIVPAANARNLGALEAVGEFLFFLDDDALLIAEPQEFCRLIKELTPQVAAAVCHRGELIDGNYLSHWPTGVTRITVQNFSAFCIEWNFIVRRELFFASGAFPEIGTGSKHAALSGEIFVLAARLLGCGHSLNTINFVRVAHPSLLKPKNTAINLLGYYYGAGYAVGISIDYFSLWAKIYWVTRVAMAAIFDSTHRYRIYSDSIQPELVGLGVRLSCARVVGFADGFFGREVKPYNWLSSMVGNNKKPLAGD